METPKEHTTAFDIIKNYWTVLVAVVMLVGNIFLTWQKVGDNQVSLKELRDQVARQYQVQREMNDKTNKEVDQLKLWVEYQKGHQQAEKDLKK